MKKKMLITGSNSALLKDYVRHSEYYFKSLSTTDAWNDIQTHFEVFEPDGFLLFPEKADEDMVKILNKLKIDMCYHEQPIFICAQADVCAEIEQKNPFLADLMLKRPVSPDNLSLRIRKHFENMEKGLNNVETKDAARSGLDNDDDDMFRAETPAKKKKHILIVDDDRTILKMLKSAMESEYEITTMVNGVLVPKFLATKKVDLVILDYEMPVETGADVFREIRMNDDYGDIPVCFLTGVAEKDKIAEILALRPDGYLLKPVNLDALLATVSNLTM